MSITPVVALPGLVPGLTGDRAYRGIVGDEYLVEGGVIDAVPMILQAEARGGPALEALEAELAGRLDDRGLQKASLLAEGFTATIALRFASTHPDRVDQLILAGPLGYITPLSGGWREPLTLADAVRGLYSGDVEQAHRSLGVLCGRAAANHEDLAREFSTTSKNAGVAQAAAVLAGWLENQEFDLTDLPHGDGVRQVQNQVSLVWGRDDLWAGLDSAFYLMRRLRNVRLRVFPGIGHLAALEVGGPLGRHVAQVLGSADTPQTESSADAPQTESVVPGA